MPNASAAMPITKATANVARAVVLTTGNVRTRTKRSPVSYDSDVTRRRQLALAFACACVCDCSVERLGSSESAVKVCGQTTVKGIDVYHGDNGGNAIDWNAVKTAGIDFAFAKATESTNFKDSAFAANWSGMKSAGLVRGAYHFFHADVDPAAQANYFLATVGALSPGDLLVLDLETTNGQTQATIAANAKTFLDTVKKASGVVPLLYTSPAFLTTFSGLGGYPLWVANYGVSCPDVPAAWTTYMFWQSSSTGSLPPITGALDLDSFNGTLAELHALGEPASDAGSDAQPQDAAQDASAPDTGSDASTPPPPLSEGCTIGVPERSRGGAFMLALALLAVGRRRRIARESIG